MERREEIDIQLPLGRTLFLEMVSEWCVIRFLLVADITQLALSPSPSIQCRPQTPKEICSVREYGVRGTVMWLANSVLRIVAYYFILLTSSRACRSSRALWSLSGHETYLIEREYRDWHSICGVQSTSAMPLHILGCKHLIYQFAYELDSEDGLRVSFCPYFTLPCYWVLSAL